MAYVQSQSARDWKIDIVRDGMIHELFFCEYYPIIYTSFDRELNGLKYYKGRFSPKQNFYMKKRGPDHYKYPPRENLQISS